VLLLNSVLPCATTQVGKLSAAAAAAEVQHTSAASALKENKALLKALQKKAAQHDKQESQHKALVEQGAQQLQDLQDAVAEAQQRLESARAAAAAAAKHSSAAKRSKHTAVDAAEEARERAQQQALQQQLAEVECELQLLTVRQAAAAAKVTRAAKAVGTLQHKIDAAADATAERDRALVAAEQEVQQAAEALAAGRLRSTAAEEAWRQAELQQQAVSVGFSSGCGCTPAHNGMLLSSAWHGCCWQPHAVVNAGSTV
jgi:chromosome segregation ATPase